MKNLNFILITALFLMISCSPKSANQAGQNTNEANRAADNMTVENPLKAGDEGMNKPVFSDDIKEKTAAQSVCTNLKRAGMKIDQKQTFPVNFAPFENSCFTTFHDPKYNDPPLDEKYYIYKDGKEIYEFPGQDIPPNYSISGVAFEDLNGDNLQDIIVVGLEQLKFGDTYYNRVYVNTGKDFHTDRDANMKLDDFTKISEIKNFVSKNKDIFFP